MLNFHDYSTTATVKKNTTGEVLFPEVNNKDYYGSRGTK